jgi:hypothetical protein
MKFRANFQQGANSTMNLGITAVGPVIREKILSKVFLPALVATDNSLDCCLNTLTLPDVFASMGYSRSCALLCRPIPDPHRPLTAPIL